jgi:CelD/BcsL family acetyltransferase involved in cellulose biosynthesis
MLKLERIGYSGEAWSRTLEGFGDRTLFQSPAWLAFIAESQRGEIVVAELRDGSTVRGYFSGLLTRRLGLSLLGSPLPGWTTSYMGFNLEPGVSRHEALSALRAFAFRELRCIHFEVMDRALEAASEDQLSEFGLRKYNGFEIDLTHTEWELFASLAPACRRCIRKAGRCGVTVEQATDGNFATDYYSQLVDVFAKQKLTPTYSVDRVRCLLRHLLPTGSLLLLRARDPDGQVIATGIFPAMHGRAYFWGGASWREFQHLRPNELLMWSAMLHWQAHKMRCFDMGGAGDYKRKYGGREICVPWLRVSRYPILSLLRNGAALAIKARQRALAAKLALQTPSFATSRQVN